LAGAPSEMKHDRPCSSPVRTVGEGGTFFGDAIDIGCRMPKGGPPLMNMLRNPPHPVSSVISMTMFGFVFCAELGVTPPAMTKPEMASVPSASFLILVPKFIFLLLHVYCGFVPRGHEKLLPYLRVRSPSPHVPADPARPSVAVCSVSIIDSSKRRTTVACDRRSKKS
jgi:hypothetical protein